MRRPASHFTALLALTGLVAATTTVTTSLAFMQDQKTVSVSVRSGDAELSASRSARTTFDHEDAALRPGSAAVYHTVVLTNGGEEPLALSAAFEQATATGLGDVLEMTIEECPTAEGACTERYAGSPAELAVDLGRELAPGDSARYRVSLSWPLTAQDPALYGSVLEGDLTWTGRSA